MEGISPEVVYLRPPEKLILEVKAKGRFQEICWSINGTLVTISQSHSTSFSNYREIYFVEETTEANFGLYEISPRVFTPFQLIASSELDIIVIPPGLSQ